MIHCTHHRPQMEAIRARDIYRLSVRKTIDKEFKNRATDFRPPKEGELFLTPTGEAATAKMDFDEFTPRLILGPEPLEIVW